MQLPRYKTAPVALSTSHREGRLTEASFGIQATPVATSHHEHPTSQAATAASFFQEGVPCSINQTDDRHPVANEAPVAQENLMENPHSTTEGQSAEGIAPTQPPEAPFNPVAPSPSADTFSTETKLAWPSIEESSYIALTCNDDITSENHLEHYNVMSPVVQEVRHPTSGFQLSPPAATFQQGQSASQTTTAAPLCQAIPSLNPKEDPHSTTATTSSEITPLANIFSTEAFQPPPPVATSPMEGRYSTTAATSAEIAPAVNIFSTEAKSVWPFIEGSSYNAPPRNEQ
ncbi:hypothetical protein M413DRAFT_32288 [Hebeloma cylindrosporum]|uniref:Uncharacterized protein n=1 Tax=Hebeloma cylindrosporum TaxID=76867 RepID=A0A0C3BWG4_HEBCY|nr:hypothetical protein M413DRAFT_32288 [Hebeloma cylindrosporum h7]